MTSLQSAVLYHFRIGSIRYYITYPTKVLQTVASSSWNSTLMADRKLWWSLHLFPSLVLIQAKDFWCCGSKWSYPVPHLENRSLWSDSKSATSLAFPATHTRLTGCLSVSTQEVLVCPYVPVQLEWLWLGIRFQSHWKHNHSLSLRKRKSGIGPAESMVQQNKRLQVHMMGWTYIIRLTGMRKLSKPKKVNLQVLSTPVLMISMKCTTCRMY